MSTRFQRDVIRKGKPDELPAAAPLADDPQLYKAVEHVREKLGDPLPAPPAPPAAG